MSRSRACLKVITKQRRRRCSSLAFPLRETLIVMVFDRSHSWIGVFIEASTSLALGSLRFLGPEPLSWLGVMVIRHSHKQCQYVKK